MKPRIHYAAALLRWPMLPGNDLPTTPILGVMKIIATNKREGELSIQNAYALAAGCTTLCCKLCPLDHGDEHGPLIARRVEHIDAHASSII